MTAYSKEPWSFDIDIDEGLAIVSANKDVVCRFSKWPNLPDLSLIRAAPELFELVLELREKFCPPEHWEGTAIDKKIANVLSLIHCEEDK